MAISFNTELPDVHKTTRRAQASHFQTRWTGAPSLLKGTREYLHQKASKFLTRQSWPDRLRCKICLSGDLKILYDLIPAKNILSAEAAFALLLAPQRWTTMMRRVLANQNPSEEWDVQLYGNDN